MRKRIRLTDRRQLYPSSVNVTMHYTGRSNAVGLTIVKPQDFVQFPKSARIRLRLTENKFSETLEFGTLDNPKVSADLDYRYFRAPSCQLRIVDSDSELRGRLLGSTNPWTLSSDDQGTKESANTSILLFLPQRLDQFVWKLDVRDCDYPVVYINENIPISREWVKTDPVFLSCVLPEIVRQVFEEMFKVRAHLGQDWARDWLNWADTLIPGRTLPPDGDVVRQEQWISDLLDSFCRKHKLLARLLADFEKKDGLQ